MLLINPPVNLYTSIVILDRLLKENIPGGEKNLGQWVKGVIEKLVEVSNGAEKTELTGEFIYKTFKLYPPPGKIFWRP